MSRIASIRLACACALLCATLAVRAADPLQEALLAAAVPIRTIDARDADFSDLAPLADAIGPARVVLLGEPGHGSGGAFAAKARLIHFLHQRMGFEVVAWESGMHGVSAAQARLAAGDEPVAAARRGIFSIWSATEEARPLFEYASGSRGGERPLVMAGFDIQFTAPGAADLLAADLRDFVAQARDPGLRREATALVDAMLAAHARLRARPQPPATTVTLVAADLEAFTRPADALLGKLRHASFAAAHSPVRVEFIARAIANLRDDGINTYESRRDGRRGSDHWNRRDARMAANLRWLLDDAFRGRKVVVWAHNAHIVRADFAAEWAAVAHAPVPGGMRPMGALLAEALPGAVYALGFTTYEGEDRWANGQKHDVIAAAPAGSLEARLHARGAPYLFVDLRAAARRLGEVGPVTMRISGFGPPTSPYGNDLVPDLARAFDGVFYIDRMTPATAVPAAK